MLKAESELIRTAERWGTVTSQAIAAITNEDWPWLANLIALAGSDISFGLAQLVVSTAGAYGIGNGKATVDNCLAVREALFDRETSIRLGARHLANCWRAAGNYDLTQWPDMSPELASLCIYNGGSLYNPSSSWWQRWATNVTAYRAALAWAKLALGAP